MTNDILEQLVEDYFREQGYFTQHNVPYRTNGKGNHSDIDVIAVHPRKKGVERVVVVNCKSWQDGVDINEILQAVTRKPEPKIRGGYMTKRFRDVTKKPWSKALIEKVKELTGQRRFTFYVAAVSFRGEKKEWGNFPLFKKNLSGCSLRLLEMKDMIEHLVPKLTSTPAHSELSRLLQLIKASKGEIKFIQK